MQSSAPTVAEYLKSLPDDRRKAIAAVRDVIRENLDSGYEEGMGYGMITYCVPLSVYPAGYHANPKLGVPFISIASQKNHMAVYVMGLYADSALARWFTEAWAKKGKKLEMGKSCIRFKKIDDLALDVLGEAVRRMTVKVYIERYEAARRAPRPIRADKARRIKPTPA